MTDTNPTATEDVAQITADAERAATLYRAAERYFKIKKAFRKREMDVVKTLAFEGLSQAEYHRGTAVLYTACFDLKSTVPSKDSMLNQLIGLLGFVECRQLRSDARQLLEDRRLLNLYDGFYTASLDTILRAEKKASLELLQSADALDNGQNRPSEIIIKTAKQPGKPTANIASSNSDSDNNVTQIISDAETLMAKAKFDEADKLLIDGLVSYPDNSNLLRKQGKLFSIQARYPEAIHVLQKAVIINPEDIRLWTLLSKACLKQKDNEGAEKAFSAALDFDRTNIYWMTALASVQGAQGKFTDAFALLDVAAGLYPTSMLLMLSRKRLVKLQTGRPADLYFKAKKAFLNEAWLCVRELSLAALNQEFHFGAAVLYVAGFNDQPMHVKQTDPKIIELIEEQGTEKYRDLEIHARKLLTAPDRLDKYDGVYRPRIIRLGSEELLTSLRVQKMPEENVTTLMP